MATRRVRAFTRWMRSEGIDCSDALKLIDCVNGEGICVKALCDLSEGDLVATIPKKSCLTVKNSGARQLIEEADLDGHLGLAAAIMYEKNLGQESPWFGYLQVLPESELIPLLWSSYEIDSLLVGTELHKTIKEDKALIYYDWKNCILPLLDSAPLKLNPEFFGIEQYFAAKSLIASRSFEIDDYHGFGMVPLADLFNHKTGAEDVHFTTELSQDKFYEEPGEDNKISTYDNGGEYEILSPHSYSMTSSSNGGELESASTSEHDPNVLEMIIVKDVKAGSEVFNTYGYVGNAALLHRYGFTEADNPYDIVNIDTELIVQWSSALFSSRHSRMRLSLWRKLDYSGCISQNSEYFEISFDGEPQVELLVLLYIILLPEEAYHDLKLEASAVGDHNKCTSIASLKKYDIPFRRGSELCKNLLLTESVCNALLSIADIRERCYGFNSLEDDTRALNQCCPIQDRKLYHSLMLRVSERRILEKLRAYSSKCIGFSKTKDSSR